MIANPLHGETALVLNGKAYNLRLSLGALAALENALKADCLEGLISRFDEGQFKAEDILHILAAGFYGGNHNIAREDLLHGVIDGGAKEAARVAVLLIRRAFQGNTND